MAALPGLVQAEPQAARADAGGRIDEALRLANQQINFARLAADRQITEVRNDLIGEVQATRIDALKAIDQTSGRAQESIGELRLDVSSHLTTMEKTLADETAKLNASVVRVAEVAPPLTAMLEMVQGVVEIETDCEASPKCIQNTLHHFSEDGQKSSKAFADLTVQVAGISADIHTVTTEFTRPRRWYEKLWSGIKAAGGVAVLAAK